MEARFFSLPSSYTSSALISPSLVKLTQLARRMAPRLRDSPCIGNSGIHPHHYFYQGSPQWRLSKLCSCTKHNSNGREMRWHLPVENLRKQKPQTATMNRYGGRRKAKTYSKRRTQKNLPEQSESCCQSMPTSSPWPELSISHGTSFNLRAGWVSPWGQRDPVPHVPQTL